MARERITQKSVAKLPAGETVWDDQVCGFGVRRQKSAAVYVLKYRFRGRQRFVTIGRHGSPWTPEDARQEARRMLGLLASKEKPRDPAAERDSAAGQMTFAAMADRYLSEYAPTRKKDRSIAEDRRNLKLHVLPAIGRMKLSDVSRSDLARFVSSRRENPVVANRCLALVSHIFTIAEKWGLREFGTNPCRGVDRYKEQPRERILNLEELALLGDALNAAGIKHEIDWRATASLWLLILTGARLQEILSLEWGWINWDECYAKLPDSKSGPKHLPLPDAAIGLLKNLQSRNRGLCEVSKFVFPSKRRNTSFSGIQKPWRKIRSDAGLDDLRIHDLRHCYASTAIASGESLYLVGQILGHKQASTTERYAHMAMQPIRDVANRNAHRLTAILKPRLEKTYG